ncbi:MAG TPA: diguanylate cyclase [Bryobacteraceae bacterium]|nr:diguanylate cyclase [Bryobacteraceae bacterium]
MSVSRRAGILAIGISVCLAIGLTVRERYTRPEPELRIGYNHSPPYSIVMPDGSPRGFSIEVLTEAARRCHIRLKWVRVQEGPDLAFGTGLADLWPLVTDVPSRHGVITFTDPWLRTTYALLAPVSRGIAQHRDAVHRRVSYANNAIANLLVKARFPDSIPVPETPGLELAGVCDGGADAALIEGKVMLARLLERPRGCESITFTMVPFEGSAYSMAIGSSARAAGFAKKLRSAITVLAEEGTLDQIYRKWLFENTDETRIVMELQQATERSRLLCWAIGCLALMVVVLIWHARRKHLAKEATRSAYEFVSAVLDTAGGLVLICDRRGHIVRMNRACERATGKTLDEIRGKSPWEVFVPARERTAVQAIFERLRSFDQSEPGAGATHINHEHHWRTTEGERLFSWSKTVLLNSARQVEYIVSTGVDITSREAIEEQLGYEAAHDPLTGLANRRYFMKAIDAAVDQARHGTPFSLCLADLDCFKLVNDTYGHSAGDQVLSFFGALLRQQMGRDSLAGRIGGDEFCLLLRGSEGFAEVERIRTAIEKNEFHASGKRFHVTATFGMATWHDTTSGAADLLAVADAALYRAKHQGRNRSGLLEPAGALSTS